jgi:hypothetical protein
MNTSKWKKPQVQLLRDAEGTLSVPASSNQYQFVPASNQYQFDPDQSRFYQNQKSPKFVKRKVNQTINCLSQK